MVQLVSKYSTNAYSDDDYSKKFDLVYIRSSLCCKIRRRCADVLVTMSP
jgi:hypothetical protein